MSHKTYTIQVVVCDGCGDEIEGAAGATLADVRADAAWARWSWTGPRHGAGRRDFCAICTELAQS